MFYARLASKKIRYEDAEKPFLGSEAEFFYVSLLFAINVFVYDDPKYGQLAGLFIYGLTPHSVLKVSGCDIHFLHGVR